MKKFYILLAMLAVFATNSFATNARISGLGFGSVPWMVASDDDLMSLFPGLIGQYKNNFIANELNKSGYIDVGMPGYTLGAFDLPYAGGITYSGSLLPTGNIVSNDTKADVETIRIPSNLCGLMAGINPSDNIGLGLMVGVGSNAASDNSTPTNYDIWTNFDRTTDFNASSLSVKLDLGASFKDTADIGLAIELPFISNTGTVDNYNYTSGSLVTTKIADGSLKTTGGVSLGLNARGMLMPLIFDVGIGISDIQTTDIYNAYDVNTGILTNSNKGVRSFFGFLMDIGACYNIDINKNVTLIPGIAANYSSSTLKSVVSNDTASPVINTTNNEVDSSAFNIPLYIAAESKINEILTVRFGVAQPLFSSTGSVTTNNIFSPATQDTMNQTLPATTVFSGGFSLNIANISLDATISNIATSISLKYSWYTTKQVE